MISVLIAEDQTLFRDSLELLINKQDDMRVVGLAANADEVPKLCRILNPQLVLLDVVTAGSVNGIAAAAEIRQTFPEIKVVIMTALPEITFVEAAQRAGANSFVYKTAGSQHLLYVIRSTVKGLGVYPGPVEGAPFATHFSDKEIAIIRLVCQGKSRSEIAQAIAMSEGSVKAVITGILNKSGFDSIMKLAVYAVANGFILPQRWD